MNIFKLLFPLCIGLCLVSVTHGAPEKKRIFIVSSYHKEYLWSQSTQRGVSEAMLKYGYLDNAEQMQVLVANDHVESTKAVIQKVWMDTKRKNSPTAMSEATQNILNALNAFRPHLVLLGDDNAANYIGTQLLDTEIPVVFWGINGLPLKYGLVDSMDCPGHNVTGVWQVGYHKESLDLLHILVPEAKTFAILACDSETSRANVKQIEALAKSGRLPLQLVDVVATNAFADFGTRALALAQQVDAFFVVNHDTMVDEQGKHVDMLEVGKWYLEHIHKPEASHEDQFVQEGMLLAANDSGYNQGHMAFEMAYDILEQGFNPGRMRTQTPPMGSKMVNRQRAHMLGISLEGKMDIIEEVVETALALKR